MCSGKIAKFSGLIGSISIKRKSCDLFLNLGRSGFRKLTCFCDVEVNNRPVKPGVIFLRKHFEASHLELGNHELET